MSLLAALGGSGIAPVRPAVGRGGATLGAALYRAGRHAEAVKRLGEVTGGSVEGQLFLAMAHHRLGAADKARQCLAEAGKRMDAGAAAEKRAALAPSWSEQTRCKLLRDEAEALLSETRK